MSEIQETPVIQEKFSDSSSDSDEPEIIEEIIKEEQNAKVIQVNISAWQVTIWRFLQASNAFSFYRSKIILDRPNCFVPGQIILVRFKLDFSGLIFIKDHEMEVGIVLTFIRFIHNTEFCTFVKTSTLWQWKCLSNSQLFYPILP